MNDRRFDRGGELAARDEVLRVRTYDRRRPHRVDARLEGADPPLARRLQAARGARARRIARGRRRSAPGVARGARLRRGPRDRPRGRDLRRWTAPPCGWSAIPGLDPLLEVEGEPAAIERAIARQRHRPRRRSPPTRWPTSSAGSRPRTGRPALLGRAVTVRRRARAALGRARARSLAGPAGRSAAPRRRGALGVSLDDIRLALVTGVFDLAGAGRSFAAAGRSRRRHRPRSAGSRGSGCGRQAVEHGAPSGSRRQPTPACGWPPRSRGFRPAAASGSRSATRTSARSARAWAAAARRSWPRWTQLEQAVRPTGSARGRGAAGAQAWQAALAAAARRLESAWLALEAGGGAEQERWARRDRAGARLAPAALAALAGHRPRGRRRRLPGPGAGRLPAGARRRSRGWRRSGGPGCERDRRRRGPGGPRAGRPAAGRQGRARDAAVLHRRGARLPGHPARSRPGTRPPGSRPRRRCTRRCSRSRAHARSAGATSRSPATTTGGRRSGCTGWPPGWRRSTAGCAVQVSPDPLGDLGGRDRDGGDPVRVTPGRRSWPLGTVL